MEEEGRDKTEEWWEMMGKYGPQQQQQERRQQPVSGLLALDSPYTPFTVD